MTTTMLVVGAAEAAGRGDTELLDHLETAILSRADTEGRDEVGRAVAEVATRSLVALWEAGWQAAELIRAVKRRGTARQGDLAITAMGAPGVWSAAKGAPMPPMWSAALTDLGVRAAGSPDKSPQDWLTPWAEQTRLPWVDALLAGLALLGTFATLPKLEVLIPPPSQWSGVTAAGIPADTDDPVLTKVRALLAKAESTAYDAEAEALTAKAQELMARHAIDEAVARQRAGGKATKPGARRFAVDDPYASAKSLLLAGVAAANGGRSIWYDDLSMMTVVAYEAELEAIDTLFTSLLVQATRALVTAGKQVDGRGRSRTRSFRQSFLVAFAGRIRERLEDAAASAADQASEELSASVLPVLASREREVDDAVAALFPKLVRRRGPTVTNRDGWAAGRTAAELAQLGPGTAVTKGR